MGGEEEHVEFLGVWHEDGLARCLEGARRLAERLVALCKPYAFYCG